MSDLLFTDTTIGQVQEPDPEIARLYGQCAQELQALEATRLEKLKSYEWRKKVGFTIGSVLTPICGYLDYLLLIMPSSGDDDKAAGITIAMLGILYGWVTSPKRAYAKAYKKEILPKIAGLLGFQYRADDKIPMELMKPSKIIPSHDYYTSDDCFSGNYKGLSVQIGEIKLEEKRGSGKNRRKVTVFKGIVLLLAYSKPKFLGHTILRRNANSIEAFFLKKQASLQRANLVDPEFEKLYDVYTTDQVEARYLMHPEMMEIVKNIGSIYDAKDLTVSFYTNHVLIMLSTPKDHFEPAGIYVPARDPISILTMKRELDSVFSVIDILEMTDLNRVQSSDTVQKLT